MKKLLTLTALSMALTYGAKATITGAASLCVGNTVTLLDSTSTAGTWSSSNTSVATVSTSSPTMYVGVTGVSAGTATISYVYGSTVETTVVTVNTAPAAIGGPSSVCTGSTIALTDATAGGTWSTWSTYYASVGSATGVVTGINAGNATISYTVGGCSVTTVVTINGTPIDSLLSGPSTVCVGSTATISTTTTGGTWSSGNTAVATVDPATGVVTGVSNGLAPISYTVIGTCGSASAYTYISVISTTSPGTISGSSSVGVGANITLASSVSGGTWSSASTAIATVDASSGVVTGVATGTTTITYTVSGCSGPASVVDTITVVPANIISGHVLFTGTTYYGPVKVYLIRYTPGTTTLYAYDSTDAYSTGTSASYSFSGAPTDSFRIKAAVEDSAATYPYTGYIPTYHTSSAYWHSATVLYHLNTASDINQDITMLSGTVTSGTGFIGGNVMTGANKGTSSLIPSVNLLMYLKDASGNIVEYTYTDASGNYSFSNLAFGTYSIYPELINYASTPYTGITLSSTHASASAANFGQHSVSLTIKPIPTAVANVNTTAAQLAMYPNPTSGKVNMTWQAAAAEQATVSVMDIAGREVMHGTTDLTAGAGSSVLDLSGLGNGLYLISVKSESFNYNTKIQIEK